MPQYKSYNDLVYAIAKRAKELGDMKMQQLRWEAGYNCDTTAEAERVNRFKNRGELTEEILVEEFTEEFDVEWEQ